MSMPNRKILTRVRAVCAALAVLAFLVFLNTSQMDEDSEVSLHTVGALDSHVTQVLAQRHAEAVTNALIEYTALLTVVVGAGVAIGAPKLSRLRIYPVSSV